MDTRFSHKVILVKTITKWEVEKTKKVRETALKKDPEFQAYTEEVEKMLGEDAKNTL